jgi:FHA domain
MDAALRGPFGKTTLEAAVLTIGSSPDNQLVVNDMKVSAHHAEIQPEGQRFSITDLGSIHGTYVNLQRLDWNTAHLLTPGSTIVIGDTTFTYVEEDAMPFASPFNDTAEIPEGTPTQSNNPAYASPQSYMQEFPTRPAHGYAPPAKRSRRRWLLISLILLLALIIAGGAIAAIVYFTRATPEKTIDAYCNALRGQDYRSAYTLLSSSLRNSETEAVFAGGQQAMGRTTICTHNTANVTGNEATANLMFISGGQNYTGIISLLQVNSDWKISVLLSSPQLTLTIFCNALHAGDTHTAYNQYSQRLKSLNPEAKFTQTFQGVTCIFSSITTAGSTDTASIVFINASGPSTPYLIVLTQDATSNSDWKINGIQAG